MRGARLERQAAEFVDDEQLRLGVEREALVEPALAVGLDQGRHHDQGGREQHFVALPDRLASERHGQMRPAAPWAGRAGAWREHEVFGDARFERLARLSNGHL